MGRILNWIWENFTKERAEVVSKFFTPVVLGLTALWFNNQISERSRQTEMVKVAVGVLQAEPAEDDSDLTLRRWAAGVLVDPAAENRLGEAAADAMVERPIGAIPGTLMHWGIPQYMLNRRPAMYRAQCLALFEYAAEAETLCERFPPGTNLFDILKERSLAPTGTDQD